MKPMEIFQSFPYLNAMPREAKEELSQRSVVKSLSHKQVLVNGGDCQYLPFVLRGTLRVYKVSETGKELTLYRIDRGESCILSATCILNTSTFPAMVEAEGPTEVILIPSAAFFPLGGGIPRVEAFRFRHLRETPRYAAHPRGRGGFPPRGRPSGGLPRRRDGSGGRQRVRHAPADCLGGRHFPRGREPDPERPGRTRAFLSPKEGGSGSSTARGLSSRTE